MNGIDGVQAVALAGFFYAVGLTLMWKRVGRGRLVSPGRALLFACGLLTTAVALGPPIDSHVGTSLTVHMTQHVLLMLVAAPLLVAGMPFPTMFWAMPDSWRVVAARKWRRVHRSVAGDAWPVWVGATVMAQALALAVWHLPAFYQAALRSNLVHSAEHASFLFSAMAFWWTIAGAVRRSRFGAGVLAVFIAKLPGLVLGVGMAIDTHVWYHAYGNGVPALQDQQCAGIVMWVGGGTVATISALALFGAWMHALERSAPTLDPQPRPERVLA